MAFSLNNFARSSSHANSDCPVIWVYRTNDTEADIEGAGYFNAVADDLNVGDMIHIHADADGTPSYEITWVTDITAGVVTIQGLFEVTASA
jgi:hypothetical protein